MKADPELAARIMFRRKLIGMRQVDLAGAVGCSPRTVRHWERAQSSPTHMQMNSIARALGLDSAADLLDALVEATSRDHGLRKRTYDLPDQDALPGLNVPSVICIRTPDGDTFIPSEQATMVQLEQYARECLQHHSVGVTRAKALTAKLKRIRLAGAKDTDLALTAQKLLRSGESDAA